MCFDAPCLKYELYYNDVSARNVVIIKFTGSTSKVATLQLLHHSFWTSKQFKAVGGSWRRSPLSVPYLLPFGVQAEQADKAADLQQEINENGQAGKERERPHCRHVGQGSCARHATRLCQRVISPASSYKRSGVAKRGGQRLYPGRRPRSRRRQRGKCWEPRLRGRVRSGRGAPHWAFAHLAGEREKKKAQDAFLVQFFPTGRFWTID